MTTDWRCSHGNGPDCDVCRKIGEQVFRRPQGAYISYHEMGGRNNFVEWARGYVAGDAFRERTYDRAHPETEIIETTGHVKVKEGG